MKTRVESKDLEDAKYRVTEAVIALLKHRASVYRDIEEAVETAFVIAENKYLWVDIHGE